MILIGYVKSLGKWVWKDKIRFALTLITGAVLIFSLALLFPAFSAGLISLIAMGSAYAALACIVVFPIMLLNAGIFICFRAILRGLSGNSQASFSDNLGLALKASIYTGLAAAFVGGGFLPVGILGAGALISIGVGAVLSQAVSLIFAGVIAGATYFLEWRAANNMAVPSSPAPLPPGNIQGQPVNSSQARAMQQLAVAPPIPSPAAPLLSSGVDSVDSSPPQPGIPLQPMPVQPLPPPAATRHASPPPAYRASYPSRASAQSSDVEPLITFPPSPPPPESRLSPSLKPGATYSPYNPGVFQHAPPASPVSKAAAQQPTVIPLLARPPSFQY
jgi:hypothetical protein